MRRLKRATNVLPLVVLALGITIPVLMDRQDGAHAPANALPEPTVSDKTATEWAAQAARAAERGEFRRAIGFIKTAESVEPGEQYADELTDLRKLRWRAAEVSRVRTRFTGSPVASVSFDADGLVRAGHRLVTVLPGESLWSLARGLAAARRGALPTEVPRGDVYAAWDELTELNGLRELEVGERVAVPLTEAETVAMAAANARDLDRLREASAALDACNLNLASELRGSLEGAFAGTTAACRSLDIALSGAAAEAARAREFALVEDARAAVGSVHAKPRSQAHTERLSLLEGALAALAEAEDVSEGSQYSAAVAAAQRMRAEEARYRVAEGGVIRVLKPAGVSYTDEARRVVEWFLERRLASSGAQFPNSREKTSDELAWARYMAAAADAAGREGRDFAALLESEDADLEVTLPDPSRYFGVASAD